MNLKRFGAYLFRWQLSSPILAGVIWLIPDPIWGTIVANGIGGCIFYWVDRWIFSSKSLSTEWEVKHGNCDECGKASVRVYRIVKGKNYDRSKDEFPKYRCEECSVKKEKKFYDLL